MNSQSSFKNKTGLKNRTKILLLFLLLILILFASILHNSRLFPVKTVTIESSYQHVSKQTLQQLIAPYMRKSFFFLDIKTINNQLLKQQWIDSVNIQRIWPNKIVIIIKEQEPVAKWNNYGLLNDQGEIFRPPQNTFPVNLPLLIGSDEQAEKIWQYYQEMNNYLERLNLSITQINLDPVAGWKLTLSNGIVIMLGNSDFMQHFNNFVVAYPKIIKTKTTPIESIDLRYTNGLAIKWKNGTN